MLTPTFPSSSLFVRASADLPTLSETLLARLERGLRAARAALLVGGETVAMRHVEAHEIAEDQLFPLRVPLETKGAGEIGLLLLGPGPDGSPLGKSRVRSGPFSGTWHATRISRT